MNTVKGILLSVILGFVLMVGMYIVTTEPWTKGEVVAIAVASLFGGVLLALWSQVRR